MRATPEVVEIDLIRSSSMARAGRRALDRWW